MAILLQPDGTQETITPRDGVIFEPVEIRLLVGKQTNRMETARGQAIMVYDSQGLLRLKPLNERASEMAKKRIAGNVLICEKSELEQ